MKDKTIQKIHEQKTRELVKMVMEKEKVVMTLKSIVDEYHNSTVEECLIDEIEKLNTLKSMVKLLTGNNE